MPPIFISRVLSMGHISLEVHFRQLIQFVSFIISFSETLIFIGHTLSHFLQFIQVFLLLTILKILNLLKIPNIALSGNRYLHQGLSTNKDEINTTTKISIAVIAASPV